MKAVLLSAGYGKRLLPLTTSKPKCLFPVNGTPLLYHWLDLLENAGIEEVIVNTHYLPDMIQDAVNIRKNKIKVTLTYEKVLLGSAGTLIENKDKLMHEESFLLLYADNYTNISLQKLMDCHKHNDGIFTTCVYKTDKPHEKGIFEFDKKTGRAISFEEKPQNPKTKFANAAIGVLDNEIFGYLEGKKVPLDFSKDILPLISRNTYVYWPEGFIIDIGNINDYQYAQNLK